MHVILTWMILMGIYLLFIICMCYLQLTNCLPLRWEFQLGWAPELTLRHWAFQIPLLGVFCWQMIQVAPKLSKFQRLWWRKDCLCLPTCRWWHCFWAGHSISYCHKFKKSRCLNAGASQGCIWVLLGAYCCPEAYAFDTSELLTRFLSF